MTRSEINAAILAYLGRPSTSGGELDLWIMATTGKLNRALADAAANQTTATVLAADGLVQLPADLMRLNAIHRGETELRQFPISTWPIPSDGYVLHGATADVGSATEDGTEHRVEYAKAIPLPDDVIQNWVQVQFPDLYIYGALNEAAVYLRKFEQGALWSAEFAARLDEVRRHAWNQRVTIARGRGQT
jgi:hypothetical protein